MSCDVDFERFIYFKEVIKGFFWWNNYVFVFYMEYKFWFSFICNVDVEDNLVMLKIRRVFILVFYSNVKFMYGDFIYN